MQSDKSRVEQHNATAGAGPAQIRTLLVDDSVEIRDLYCMMARTAGDIELLPLDTTNDLDKVVMVTKPSVVVLDLTIPGESPLDAMRALHDTRPDLRMLAFSGYDDDETLDKVFDAGGWGLVSKGGDAEALFDTIRRVAHA